MSDRITLYLYGLIEPTSGQVMGHHGSPLVDAMLRATSIHPR